MSDAKIHRVCESSDIAENIVRVFRVERSEVLIGRVKGKLFACNNSCPHRGASLALGHMQGENIVCYMHGYEYNVFDGQLVNMKSWKKEETWMEQSPAWRQSGDLRIYKVTEHNGQVYVQF